MELLQNSGTRSSSSRSSQFVIPDWGALIALLPVFMGVVVVVFFVARLVACTRRIGPTRAGGRGRVKPVAARRRPHAGPDLRPDLRRGRRRSSCSSGLVFGGPAPRPRARRARPDPALLGPRGARRLRPRRRRRTRSCRRSSTTGRRPGVHMPGPSFRPILASLGRRRAVRRARLRRLGPARRRRLHDRHAPRLAERRPQGVPPRRRGRHDRPPRERAGAGAGRSVCSCVVAVLARRRGGAQRRAGSRRARRAAAASRRARRRRPAVRAAPAARAPAGSRSSPRT